MKNQHLNYSVAEEIPDEFNFVSDSQEIEAILEYIGYHNIDDFGCLFVLVGDGDYDVVYGCERSVPYTNFPIELLFAYDERYFTIETDISERSEGSEESEQIELHSFKLTKNQNGKYTLKLWYIGEKKPTIFYTLSKKQVYFMLEGEELASGIDENSSELWNEIKNDNK